MALVAAVKLTSREKNFFRTFHYRPGTRASHRLPHISRGSALPEIRSALLIESGGGGATPVQRAPPAESLRDRRFPAGHGWTHYAILMRVARPEARASGGLSSRPGAL